MATSSFAIFDRCLHSLRTEKRLEPLTGASGTFRHTARELLAMSAFRAKDAAAIKRWSDMIVNDIESPAGMRGRIEALLALSGIAKG